MSLYHRDAFGRVSRVDETRAGQEHYLRASDGRLRRLRVQGADNVKGYGQGNWERTGPPRSRISAILKLAYWTYSSVLVKGSEKRRYTPSAVLALVLKWIPACLILVVLLLIPQDLEGVFKNGGYYDPVQYRDWRYPKVSRNLKEGESEDLTDEKDTREDVPLLEGGIELEAIVPGQSNVLQVNEKELDEEFDDLPARHFRPRWLCFLEDGPRGKDTEYKTWRVTDWIKEHSDYAGTDFVFISYTRRQFLIGANQKWRGKPEPDAETKAKYQKQCDADRAMVLAYSMEAARTAGKRAFWLDFECIRDADNVARATAQSDDVYRICDIVRAAHSLVVLVGTPHDERVPDEEQQKFTYDPVSMDKWLQEWGTRLWTLPEILLCSLERRVKLYAVGGPNPPEEIAKRNVAARSVWPDAKRVRQLIDHYESSVHLTPLELVSIALECFSWRTTDQFNDGDISYALMGLLRRRPAVVNTDKSFEAFARLSLANDSNKLLERLICMQPTRRDAPWHQIRDAWGAKLWDIESYCQVAGIVDPQTITLDGAYGATIQWNAMEQVAFLKRPTLSRLLGKILLRGVPVYLITGLALTILGGVLFQNQSSGSGSGSDSSSSSSGALSGAQTALLVPGLVFLVPAVIITLLIPVMLLDIYHGKFWSTQAHFIGLQGIPDDIGKIERLLFGFNHGRLKWSIGGSTLSRNGRSETGERLGLPPLKAKQLNHGAKDGAGGVVREEVFTLIDTYAMTATAFSATRPPTAVVVCGHEGGMQRAVLCSYDWQEQKFIREAVIRVKTLVLDRMFRIDRFRFALGRGEDSQGEKGINSAIDSVRLSEEAQQKGFWAEWKIDLALLPFMWLVYGVFLPKTIAIEHIGSRYLGIELSAVAFLIVQPLNYILFRKFHLGRVVGVATLLKGVIAIIYVFVQNKSGLLFLHFVFGIAEGILLPAFVYLTGLWYDGAWGRTLRIVVWGFGKSFFTNLPDTKTGGVFVLALVWSVICVLLSGYAYLALGSPEQASWLLGIRKSTSSDVYESKRTDAFLQINSLFQRARTYLFIITFLLVTAFSSLTVDYVTSNQYYTFMVRASGSIPTAVLSSIFPLLLVLFIVALFAQFRHTQLPMTILLITLSFAGKTVLKTFPPYEHSNGLSDGLMFLQSLGSFALILTWALLLTNMVEPQALLGTLCLAFAGAALGEVITNAWLTSAARAMDRFEDPYDIVVDTSRIETVSTVFYALAVAVLLSWVAYRLWSERRDYGRAGTAADASHQQIEEHYDDHSGAGYHSQASITTRQAQGNMPNYYNSESHYGAV
ncbi:hypothetical protein GGR55DRAFT_646990 [Xylaria sp. FL0064]|nr:hypothetical protein GGR55DRAFT_646990 [Xylaria sp. FL0064]